MHTYTLSHLRMCVFVYVQVYIIYKCISSDTIIILSLIVLFYKGDTTEADKSDFLKEIKLMKKVSTGNNPYVINMVGCCTTQEPLALIIDFAPNGDLLTFLRAHKKEVYTYT